MLTEAKQWLGRIQRLELPSTLRIMNVCGGHERSITQAGLRSLLSDKLELIPGPGCPVCICPEEDLYAAIQLALHEPVTLLTYGDMLRVPVNVAKGSGQRGEPRTLMAARASGADIQPVASPQQVLEIARDNPGRQICFFMAGFETTTAPLAALLAEGVPNNLSILLSARLTWPAVAMLLNSEAPGFDGLIAPGHVAAIMGAEQWRFVVQRHGIASAVAGFSAESLLAAIYSTLRQVVEGTPMLDNCYREVVREQGNLAAQQIIDQVLTVVDGNWRGIGMIPSSGFQLRDEYARHDARKRFAIVEDAQRKRAGEMPPGCECAQVVLGRIYPKQCALYGRSCTPRQPMGPCMVSDEGACRIWWSNGVLA